MKLQRFFIEQKIIPDSEIKITDKDTVSQIRNVFRMKKGDIIGVLDNSGTGFEALINDFGKDEVILSVTQKEMQTNNPEKEVWLYVSIPKKDKFELVIEKATEMGVSHIVPVISGRTEKQNIKTERALKIIKEASEQSERGIMPVLHETVPLGDIEFDSQFFVLDRDGKEIIESKISDLEKVSVLIGPEGGWNESDRELFQKNNLEIISMGQGTLRAETASIAISAILLLN